MTYKYTKIEKIDNVETIETWEVETFEELKELPLPYKYQIESSPSWDTSLYCTGEPVITEEDIEVAKKKADEYVKFFNEEDVKEPKSVREIIDDFWKKREEQDQKITSGSVYKPFAQDYWSSQADNQTTSKDKSPSMLGGSHFNIKVLGALPEHQNYMFESGVIKTKHNEDK